MVTLAIGVGVFAKYQYTFIKEAVRKPFLRPLANKIIVTLS